MTDTRSTSDLVTLSQPHSAAAEAYRTVRTSLDFSSLDRSLRTLVVTSAAPNEGKSTTLANLGVTLAQAGRRTLLVDADLRRPSLHHIFRLPNSAGLTTMLLDESTLAAPPFQVGPVEGLLVLTSGPLPPNPAELMASRRIEALVAALRDQADIVLFDAPPLIAVSDAATLAARVDGVILVVQAEKTKREHVQRAKTLLDRAKAHLIGAVLTDVRLDRSVGYYGSDGTNP
ncbi:MAG: CpsD/CapB family tyrosine-protein kinase [Anaerolineae bacterium]|nr:CpsD/CapB family tyrosine-protein kinase [Anaerolineae bacterium]